MKKYLGPRARKMRRINKTAAQKPVKRFMRPSSKRMTKLRRLYLEIRNQWISGKTCAVHGRPCRATECHHVRGRTGTLLIDKRFWIPVCTAGHAWIHEEIQAARAQGFIQKWGQAPRDAETRRLRDIMKELTR